MPLNVNSTNYFLANNKVNTFIYDYEFKKIHKENLVNAKLAKTTNHYLGLNSNCEFISKNSKGMVSKNGVFNYLIDYNSKYILNNHKLNAELVNLNTSYTTTNYKNYKISVEQLKKLSSINNVNFKTANPEYYLKRSIKHTVNLVFNKGNYNKLSLFESDKLDNTLISAENIRTQNTKNPVYLIKGTLNSNTLYILQNNVKLNIPQLLTTQKYYTDIATKPSHVEQFWGFRQKRYKKLRPHSFLQNTKYLNNSQYVLNKHSQSLSKYNLYTAFKNNKYKNELISVTLARRLLRTKRTLILPVHVNLTLITNSYDVVHS